MKNKISFWQLLTNYKVVIPIIQRDYAQGREGKEHIREKFLTQIKNAIETDNTSQSGELDFVYGTTSKDGIFYPLDGQQRLTTLWLLHWFIACKAGVLNEAKEILKKFSYETRTSSREFCEKLCDFDIKNEKHIVKAIQKQPWFYSTWKQDLTIQAMLRMLSGTDKKNEQGHNFIDGIEECFNEGTDFKALWDELIDKNCLIKFSKLEINSAELPVSDDLYIKMNARGKALSSFENFKADLIDYINRNDQFLREAENNDFTIKIDTAWTDIFWNKKSMTNSIDEIYFAFINRVFFNEICLAKKSDDKFLIENKKEDDNRTYRYLNNEKSSYQSFEEYKYINGHIPETTLKRIYSLLEFIHIYYSELCESDILGCPWDKNFRFIPEYETNEKQQEIIIDDTSGNKVLKVTGLSQQQRVVFFAICKFICDFNNNHNNSFNEDNKKAFKEWMRVVWNLVSIQAADGIQTIRSFDSMRNVMDKINALNSQYIYSFLEQQQPTSPKTEFEQQYKEEIEKAKKIKENSEWESKIIEAEKFAFFKGAIRFLYTDAEGKVNWEQFDEKFKNAKKYFNEKGLIDDQYPNANKIIISFCNDWDNQLKRKYLFGKKADNWRNILINQNFCVSIHQLLTNGKIKESVEIANNYLWSKNVIETLKGKEDIWLEMETNSIDYYQLEWQYGVPCLWLSRYPALTIRLYDINSDEFLNLFRLNNPKYVRNKDYRFELDGEQYIWKPYISSVEKVEGDKVSKTPVNDFVEKFKGKNTNFRWIKE